MKRALLAVLLVLTTTAVSAQSFEPPIRINTDAPGATQLAPYVAVDRAGTIYVAWHDYWTNARGDIRLSRSTDHGTTFSAPVAVRSGGRAIGGSQDGVHMTIDPAGRLHFVWTEQSTNGTYHPYYSNSTDGGATFSAPRSLGADSLRHNQEFSSIAVDSVGRIYVAWVDDREPRNGISSNSQIYFTRSTDGGETFSPPIRASVFPDGGSCECCNTSIAAGPGDQVFISFRANVHHIRDIHIARSRDAGVTFDTPILVASESWPIEACPLTGSSIAVDRSGRAFVAWRDSRPSAAADQPVFFNSLAPGSNTADADQRISTMGGFNNYPSLALEPDGDLLVVFQSDRNKDADIFVARSSDGGESFSMEEELPLGDESSRQLFPVLAVGPVGERYVVWQDDRADAGDIYFARDLSNATLSVDRIDDDAVAFELAPTVLGSDARSTMTIVGRGALRVTLYDAIGRELGMLLDERVDGRIERPIELGELPSGVYFLRAVIDGKAHVRRVVR